MKPCRECQHGVTEPATACPQCGAPYPAKDKWDGWGYEYKSDTTFLGLPLLHVSFKFRPNRVPVLPKGFIAISQFTVAGFALAQFALAHSLIAQIGIYTNEGHGQLVISLSELLGML